MPGGSKYPGPSRSLDLYTSLVNSTIGDAVVKGAKTPYTSRNGHMFSFLDEEGTMALRLDEDAAADFMARYESGPVTQYGSVMRGYVLVPEDLLERTEELVGWFERSYDWIGTLPLK